MKQSITQDEAAWLVLRTIGLIFQNPGLGERAVLDFRTVGKRWPAFSIS